ncbi:hypothetical protein [Candidatus Leptofilum sp.]
MLGLDFLAAFPPLAILGGLRHGLGASLCLLAGFSPVAGFIRV